MSDYVSRAMAVEQTRRGATDLRERKLRRDREESQLQSLPWYGELLPGQEKKPPRGKFVPSAKPKIGWSFETEGERVKISDDEEDWVDAPADAWFIGPQLFEMTEVWRSFGWCSAEEFPATFNGQRHRAERVDLAEANGKEYVEKFRQLNKDVAEGEKKRREHLKELVRLGQPVDLADPLNRYPDERGFTTRAFLDQSRSGHVLKFHKDNYFVRHNTYYRKPLYY